MPLVRESKWESLFGLLGGSTSMCFSVLIHSEGLMDRNHRIHGIGRIELMG